MTNTLFPMPDSPSPRMRWLEKHKVVVEDATELGTRKKQYCAHFADDDPDKSDLPYYGWGYGDSADDALADFASKNNLKLWNEENQS